MRCVFGSQCVKCDLYIKVCMCVCVCERDFMCVQCNFFFLNNLGFKFRTINFINKWFFSWFVCQINMKDCLFAVELQTFMFEFWYFIIYFSCFIIALWGVGWIFQMEWGGGAKLCCVAQSFWREFIPSIFKFNTVY